MKTDKPVKKHQIPNGMFVCPFCGHWNVYLVSPEMRRHVPDGHFWLCTDCQVTWSERHDQGEPFDGYSDIP